MDPARKLARYEDLFALGEDARAEILGGVIEALPAPLPRQSKTQGALRRFIGGPLDDDDGFGGPGGWWIFVEVDVELGPHDVVRPDLAGWRRSRLPEPDHRPIRVVPDWVCEIVSPTSVTRDRVVKKSLYAKHGIGCYWQIDPDACILEALELVNGRWAHAGSFDDSAVARVPPFDAIELPIGRLFLPKPPSVDEG